MIGDVIRAEKKLKKLVGREIAKKLSARVQKAEAQNWTESNIVANVNRVTGGVVFALILKHLDILVEVMRLLSTRPHTTSNSKYLKFVYNSVNQKEFAEYLEKVHVKEILSDEDVKYLDEVKGELEKYLKREAQYFSNRKHKDVSEKMQSLREVNRLKVTMTALTINVIDYAKELNNNNKAEAEKAHQDAVEEGKKAGRSELLREQQEKSDKEKHDERETERIRAGRLTDDEYSGLFYTWDVSTEEFKNIASKIEHMYVPQNMLINNAKYTNGKWVEYWTARLESMYKLTGRTKPLTFKLPYSEHVNLEPLQEALDDRVPDVTIVDDKGTDYKTKVARAKTEKRIQSGNLTDYGYELLLLANSNDSEKVEQREKIAKAIQIIAPTDLVLEKISTSNKDLADLIFNIYVLQYNSRKIVLKCVKIPGKFKDSAKKLVNKFRETTGAENIDVVDENGKSYKKELEEEEQKRLEKIQKGDLTDDEYRTLLYGDIVYGEGNFIAKNINIVKPPLSILNEYANHVRNGEKLSSCLIRLISALTVKKTHKKRITVVIPSKLPKVAEDIMKIKDMAFTDVDLVDENGKPYEAAKESNEK